MENYEVMGILGKGSFGSVSKIKRKADGRILVWKEMNYGHMEEKEKQLVVQEVNILQKLRHPHIVRYYDRIIDRESTTLRIVMEFCPCGDLAGLIKKCRIEKQYIDEDVIWKILLQILQALAECHNRKDGIILHRDIKPGNIFLDQGRNVKLGDFGLARVLGDHSHFANTYVGTPFYMSPEQMAGLPYNEKCDVWSLGCLIYELAALVPPFDAATQAILTSKIKAGKYAKLPPQYSEELCRLIAMMLSVDRIKRPSVNDLLNYPPVCLRMRERKLNQHYQLLKKKEEDLAAKEAELIAKEQQLYQREKEIAMREKALGIISPATSYDKENDGSLSNQNILNSGFQALKI
eukprot:TRINITY_DN4109_c0_g1_i1.p1 TRINITY_DN4109_c0_g1~~TRINITY_DN4109_c0_g1_i1.p1  ORF type:complete len:359 (-),score=82.41 TRINITY_DN4109_c0_g1_i1:103-1149(-)